jgi:hypothetical protein
MTTIVSGIVNADGSIQSGSGFTTVHENTGLYQIIFNQKFPSSPAVAASQNWNNVYPGGGDTRDGAVPVYITPATTEIKTGNNGGTPADRCFSFIAAL